MYKSEAIRAIRGMGMSARTVMDTDEIRVTFTPANIVMSLGIDYRAACKRAEDFAYYTNDPADALHTACAMKQHGY